MTLVFARNQNRMCSRCGADLTDPASEERGTGPICAGKNTVLFARSIRANYAGALAIILGIHPGNLPEEVHQRFDLMKDRLTKQATRSALRETDPVVIQRAGQDLREVIKDIDWILSHRMEETIRRFLIKTVKFLGYVELAGVLSQEASTTPAKVWFDQGRVFLKGKTCRMGFHGMKRIAGIQIPPRGSELPYSAPASQAETFLEVVQEFWPLYEGKIEELRTQIKDWLTSNPEAVHQDAVYTVAYLTSQPGGWIQVSFPWVKGKAEEMYRCVDNLKQSVPYKDRKYNPVTKTWLVRETHKPVVEQALKALFEVQVVTTGVDNQSART